MPIDWGSVASDVSVSAIAILACAWVIRKLFTLQLSKDLETHKAKLLAGVEQSREQYSILQTKRAGVLEQMYGLLSAVYRVAQEFQGVVVAGNEEQYKAHALELDTAIINLATFNEDHGIYFPERVCEKIMRLHSEVAKSSFVHNVTLSLQKGDFENARSAPAVLDANLKANKILADVVTPAKKSIELEFRKILGVEES